MLDPLTEGLAVVTQPIQSIANAPYTVTNALIDFFASRSKMQNRNARLIEEVRELTYGSQRLAAIEAENTRLRALLGSRKRLSEGVLVAEIVGVDPNTQRREVVLDKGERDGVAVSHAVIDAEGLFGQVVATTNSNARV